MQYVHLTSCHVQDVSQGNALEGIPGDNELQASGKTSIHLLLSPQGQSPFSHAGQCALRLLCLLLFVSHCHLWRVVLASC